MEHRNKSENHLRVSSADACARLLRLEGSASLQATMPRSSRASNKEPEFTGLESSVRKAKAKKPEPAKPPEKKKPKAIEVRASLSTRLANASCNHVC